MRVWALGMHIRPVQPGDFESIAALNNWFIAHTAVHFGTAPVPAAELRGAWEESRERYPFLVGEVDGRFAGFAKAGVWRERAAYRWTTETSIYMEAWTRGKGLGTRLYLSLLDELRARGFESAIGGATLPNDASARLHERCGFVSVGRVLRAGYKFGAWHDVGFWQVMLGDGGTRG